MMDKKLMSKIGIVIALIAVLCIILNLVDFKAMTGVKYLQAQESKDLDQIVANIEEMKTRETDEAIISGKYDIFAMLGNFVFYGDSRVEHFYSYGYVDQARIFASSNGMTYAQIPNYDEQLVQINPDNIFVSYGVNDIYYKVADDFENGYSELVELSLQHLRELAPNATIYVCGMISVNPSAGERLQISEDDKNEVNTVYQQECDKMDNVYYIDCETLSPEGSADIYVSDGYHFVSEFYPTWTQYIVEHMQ